MVLSPGKSVFNSLHRSFSASFLIFFMHILQLCLKIMSLSSFSLSFLQFLWNLPILDGLSQIARIQLSFFCLYLSQPIFFYSSYIMLRLSWTSMSNSFKILLSLLDEYLVLSTVQNIFKTHDGLITKNNQSKV